MSLCAQGSPSNCGCMSGTSTELECACLYP
jgi:hypothetical protein